jgi:DNA-binding NtrC family response regulator
VAKQPWPGNVRQLRHAVLRAMHLAGPLLTASDIVGTGASPDPRAQVNWVSLQSRGMLPRRLRPYRCWDDALRTLSAIFTPMLLSRPVAIDEPLPSS